MHICRARAAWLPKSALDEKSLFLRTLWAKAEKTVDSDVHVPPVTAGAPWLVTWLHFGVFQSIVSPIFPSGQKLPGPIRGRHVTDKEFNQSEAGKLGGNRKCDSEVRH